MGFDNTGTGGIAKVRQENSYYAFGLIMPGNTVARPGNDNKNLYNGGSEWQKDYNNLPDYYQTFYRNYDAALGRWIGVDPMAEGDESMTTYQYAGNNPVMFNDPLGNLKANPMDYPDYHKPLGLPALPQGGGGDMFANADAIENSFNELQAWSNAIDVADALSNNINVLWASDNGGHGDAYGITFFDSPYTAMKAGYADLQASGLSGSSSLPGSALTFDQALFNYDTNPSVTGPAYTVTGNTYDVNRAKFSLTNSREGYEWNPKADGVNSIFDGPNVQAHGSLMEVVINGNKKEGVSIGPYMDRIAKVGEIYDNAVTTAKAIVLVKIAWSSIGESGALRSLGQLTGLVSVYDNLHGFSKDWKTNKVGAVWHMTRAIATTGFWVFEGEELAFSWNLITLGVDKTRLFGE